MIQVYKCSLPTLYKHMSLPPLCFGIQQREWTQVGEHSNYDLTSVIVATNVASN